MISPLVTVVIPAFNASATVLRAIDSACNQTFPSTEIIVVDDLSTDTTREIVDAANRPKVRLICHDRNQGASAARNTGIHAACGEYIAFLDSDDYWLPEKLTKQLAVIQPQQRMSLVTCDSLFVNTEGVVFRRSHEFNPPVTGENAWKALLACNFIPTPTVLARRSLLLEVGGFNPALPIAEDLDLWIRLAIAGPIGVVAEPLVMINDQPGSLINRHLRDEQEILLSVIERYLETERDRIETHVARRILGQRMFRIGANHYAKGWYRQSLRPFLRSALLGYQPAKSLFNIPRALAMSVLKGT